jgi:hypothetical protein
MDRCEHTTIEVTGLCGYLVLTLHKTHMVALLQQSQCASYADHTYHNINIILITSTNDHASL